MKVYLADTFHPYLHDTLRAKGMEPVQGKPLHTADVDTQAIDCTIIIVSTKSHITKEVIDKLPQLKLIACAGSGMDYVDTAYAESKHITCINTPEGNRDSVAEHAIGLILTLLHNIQAYNDVLLGSWQPYNNRPIELKGKTVGIIGYGNTGSALAKRLSMFECTVLAYDKYETGFGNAYVTESTRDDIYAQADILSLHVPLTTDTHHLINAESIQRFKKEIIFINTSRGEVVDTHAIIQALETGKIKAAGLDVVEDEKDFKQSALYAWLSAESYAQHDIHKKHRLVVTPHIAGKSVESRERIATILTEKIVQWEKVNNGIPHEIY